jgi:hypothetical protein
MLDRITEIVNLWHYGDGILFIGETWGTGQVDGLELVEDFAEVECAGFAVEPLGGADGA